MDKDKRVIEWEMTVEYYGNKLPVLKELEVIHVEGGEPLAIEGYEINLLHWAKASGVNK